MARKKELSNDLKLLIVKRLKSGISQRQIAQTFGYAQSTVPEIWKKSASKRSFTSNIKYIRQEID